MPRSEEVQLIEEWRIQGMLILMRKNSLYSGLGALFEKQKREPSPCSGLNLSLNYTIDSFLRRDMKPSKPRPAINIA